MLFNSCTLMALGAVVAAAPVEVSPAVLSLSYVNNVVNMINIVNKGKYKLAQVNGQSTALGNIAALAQGSSSASSSSGTVTNEDVSYVAPINVGGATQMLIVDTGSSNTWCGAHKSCEKTSTGKSTGNIVQVTYGSGGFIGTEYTDNVSFGGKTAKSQSIGSAAFATGFTNVDGIIGFGPVGLTANTVTFTSTVPTFMDTLYSQGSIPSEVLGVYFKPESGADTNDANGELTLGGVDTTKYTGPLTYFPRVTSGNAAPYWGIAISSFQYGGKALGGTNVQGIVDTGTTLIYIPTDSYNAFLSATGGSTDATSGLVSFPTPPTQNFTITFGSTSYVLTPAQYLVPQAQYSNFNLASGKSYAFFGDGGSSSSGSVNAIIGQKFLENFYSVYDTTASRIGFATRA